MQNRDQFYPDIETKFDHLITHMSEKNNMTGDLVKIMRGICDLQLFYSSNLDKFANSISKLLVGKDPIKDILIIYERIIYTKSEESSKIAQQIKDDLIPFLESSIDLRGQQRLKDQQKQVKEIRLKMQKKLRNLYSNEKIFRQAIFDTKNFPPNLSYSQKQSIHDEYKKRQIQFSDSIDSFNANLDDYMLKYSQLCEELSVIETQRKTNFRDAVRKVIIFQMNNIKNIQYNLARYMQSLNKNQAKLLIQDRMMIGGQPFYDKNQRGGMVQLAKLSNKNYIEHVVGKKKMQTIISEQEKQFKDLRSTAQAGKVDQEKFHQIACTLFKILDYANQHMDAPLLKQIVFFSKDIYYQLDEVKIELLTAILCHNIFGSTRLWETYGKRLTQKITKQEINSLPPNQRDKILISLLKKDLQFLTLIDINPLITNLIDKFTIPLQNGFERPQDLKTVPNISQTKPSINFQMFM